MSQVESISTVAVEIKTGPGSGSDGVSAREGLSAVEIKRRWLGIGLCALAGVLYGIQGPLVKLVYSTNINLTTLLTIRFVVAAAGIWGLVALTRPSLRLSASKIAGLGGLGVLFVTNALFFYLALNSLAAGTATLLVFSFPALVVLWSVLFLGEKLGRWRLAALGLALVGCALTIDPLAALATGQNFSWPGALFALGSALSNSVYVVLSSKFSRGVPGLVAAAWSVPVTAVLYAGWCVVSGQFQFDLTPAGWLLCSGIGLLTAIAIGIYLNGVQLIGSSQAAITSTTEPATAVLLSVVFLSEPASPIKLLGGALIVVAVVGLSRRSRTRGQRGISERAGFS